MGTSNRSVVFCFCFVFVFVFVFVSRVLWYDIILVRREGRIANRNTVGDVCSHEYNCIVLYWTFARSLSRSTVVIAFACARPPKHSMIDVYEYCSQSFSPLFFCIMTSCSCSDECVPLLGALVNSDRLQSMSTPSKDKIIGANWEHWLQIAAATGIIFAPSIQ